MFHLLSKIFLLIILHLIEGNIIAQTNILINDSLAVHADTLEIKIDDPMGTNLKFSMGEYTIITENVKWNNSMNTKERLLGLREVTDIIYTSSFVISDSSSNMATVTIEEKRRDNTYRADKAISFYLNNTQDDFYFENGSEGFSADGKPIGRLKNLTVQITFNGDSSSSWTFYIEKAKGNQWKPPIDLFLTNGAKTFNLYHVSSDAYFDYSHPHPYRKNRPAMGVEFFENKKSLCAVQYDSGTTYNLDLDPNQTFGCKAWMLHDLDRKTKLVLAATMSILMMLNNQYLSSLK